MKKLILILIMLIGTSIWSFGQDPETLQHSSTSYVDDFAGMFSPEQSQDLDGIIRSFKDTVQISLVTVKSLNGLEPFEFATRLGNKWGVGSKSDNGLLILICPSEHKFFAATGKGIQGDLTDLMAARLYDDYAKPKYKESDFYGGTRDVLIKYIEHLSPAGKALHAAQEQAIASQNAKSESNFLNAFIWTIAILLIGGAIIVITKRNIRLKNEEDKRKRDEQNKINKLVSKFNDTIIALDKMHKTLSFEPDMPESKKILADIDILNAERVKVDRTNTEQITAFLNSYEAFITNSSVTIKQFNSKKTILDNGLNAYNKYNVATWRQLHNELVNKITASLQNMVMENPGKYTEGIKQMNVLITSIIDTLTELKKAIDAKDTNLITSIINNIQGMETKFDNLNNMLSNIVSNDVSKQAKARNAKSNLEHEIQTLLAYTSRKGVSNKAIDQTRQSCTALSNRLNEFDNMDLIKAYALYTLLYGQLDTCKSAMNESRAYEAEQDRKRREKEEEERRIRDAAAAVARRKREEQDEEDRRRRSSYSSSSSSSSSYDSSSSSSSYDSSSISSSNSSFGGGSFDGGGGGGGW